jgi:hypothetical protein
MSNCEHDCEKPLVFPLRIFNRPALEQISYRIGTYSRMREHMLDELNKDLTLQNWTHRAADDPGIALLEGNALIGDILAFYQNLYANEIYLRTAIWRESITELVQLTGYRLAPGVGGEANFAVKIKGDAAVTVPQGFGFKAQLRNRDIEDEFESSTEITAYPHLSEFNLYRPAQAMQSIAKGKTQLELHAVEGEQGLNALQAVAIAKGDRILLVPDSDMFDDNGVIYTTQDKPETLIVSALETVLDRVIITLEGALQINRGDTIRAYKIDRTFRHFGYNASRLYAAHELSNGSISEVTLETTNFERNIYGNLSATTYYSGFAKQAIPLDQEVDDLALGGKLICQGIADFEDGTIASTPQRNNQHYIVVKMIEETSVDNLRWGSVEASTTVVSVDNKLMTNDDILFETTDIRRSVFHEATSPELTLKALSEFNDGDFSDGDVEFFGSYSEVRALAERDLMLVDAQTEIVQSVKTTSGLSDFDNQLIDRDVQGQWLWTVTLDQIPEFSRESFDHSQSKITVYGNTVAANQGKTETEVVLGNGDNRLTFQTFVIPKTPLTYLLDATQTPAQQPELDVYVNNILWRQVDSFFNVPAEDQIYVIREDKDGNSFVQFGDGKTGSRLPSGDKNIIALYRTGIAASGLLEKDKKPSVTGKLSSLEKVYLPAEVVGGDIAESGDNAREAAPGKMQSLGRLVGLSDFEAEALALPGVLKVRADWVAPNGTVLISIVVLTAIGTSAAVDKVQQTLNGFNRCRGAARYPIMVEQGLLQYIYLNVRVGYATSYRQVDIEAEVKLALGLVGAEGEGINTDVGLFSLALGNFGQGTHRSRILAAIQQVDGVTWVEIDAAQAINLGSPPETDPIKLVTPAIASSTKSISCSAQRILTLHSHHLDLSLVVDSTQEECE